MNKLLSLACVTLLMNSVVYFGAQIGIGYYAGMAGILLMLAISMGNFRIDMPMVFLYAASAFSLATNEVPELFRAWERLLAFVLLTGLLSPALENAQMRQFRVTAFWLLQWAMLGLATLSFLLSLVGFVGSDPAYYSGVTSHSMLLSPISAAAALFAFFVVAAGWVNSGMAKRVVVLAMAGSALAMVLKSSSRAALIALLAGVLFSVFFFRKSLSRLLFYGVVGALMGALAMVQWSEVLTEGLSRKAGETSLVNAESRAGMWTQRIAEFKSSPLVGIGFGAVDLTGGAGSSFADDGKVETGTSWLAVASMLGLVGCLAVLAIFVQAAISLRRMGNRGQRLVAGYLAALLVMWSVHMFAEGYILAAGSFLFANVWLLIGTISALDRDPTLHLIPAHGDVVNAAQGETTLRHTST